MARLEAGTERQDEAAQVRGIGEMRAMRPERGACMLQRRRQQQAVEPFGGDEPQPQPLRAGSARMGDQAGTGFGRRRG